MDKKELRKKYQELYEQHKKLSEMLKDKDAVDRHASFARAYLEILNDLNK